MKILEPAVVVSHISQKTSEIWGTHLLVTGKQELDESLPALGSGKGNQTRVPHISLVFCEMWDSTNVSRADF
jgi:hypothetical protein